MTMDVRSINDGCSAFAAVGASQLTHGRATLLSASAEPLSFA